MELQIKIEGTKKHEGREVRRCKASGTSGCIDKMQAHDTETMTHLAWVFFLKIYFGHGIRFVGESRHEQGLGQR